jgi:glutamine synthetase
MPARLPRDLFDALQALRLDEALRSALGPAFCEEFLKLKTLEWEAYSQHISEWELQKYAEAF